MHMGMRVLSQSCAQCGGYLKVELYDACSHTGYSHKSQAHCHLYIYQSCLLFDSVTKQSLMRGCGLGRTNLHCLSSHSVI